MPKGDHIRSPRGIYWHHGIDCGDGTVIHYSGGLSRKTHAIIQSSPLDEFAEHNAIEIVDHCYAFPTDQVVARAQSRLGECRYSLAFNNCEHFAVWCKTGDHLSEQIENAVEAAVDIAAGIATDLSLQLTTAEPTVTERAKSTARSVVRMIGHIVSLGIRQQATQ